MPLVFFLHTLSFKSSKLAAPGVTDKLLWLALCCRAYTYARQHNTEHMYMLSIIIVSISVL